MTSAAQRRDRRHGMRVIGRRHHDGIDARLIDETAEVIVCGRVRKSLRSCGEIVVVNIAQRDDVLADEIIDAELGLAGRADEADVQFVVGRSARSMQACAGKSGSSSAKNSLFEKTPAWDRIIHVQDTSWRANVKKI